MLHSRAQRPRSSRSRTSRRAKQRRGSGESSRDAKSDGPPDAGNSPGRYITPKEKSNGVYCEVGPVFPLARIGFPDGWRWPAIPVREKAVHWFRGPEKERAHDSREARSAESTGRPPEQHGQPFRSTAMSRPHEGGVTRPSTRRLRQALWRVSPPPRPVPSPGRAFFRAAPGTGRRCP